MRVRQPERPSLGADQKAVLRKAVHAIRDQASKDDPDLLAALELVYGMGFPWLCSGSLSAYRCLGGEWFVADAARAKAALIRLITTGDWSTL